MPLNKEKENTGVFPNLSHFYLCQTIKCAFQCFEIKCRQQEQILEVYLCNFLAVRTKTISRKDVYTYVYIHSL